MRNISTKCGVAKMSGGTVRRKKIHDIGKTHPSILMEIHKTVHCYPVESGSAEKKSKKKEDPSTNLERLRQSLANMNIGGGVKKTYAKF